MKVGRGYEFTVETLEQLFRGLRLIPEGVEFGGFGSDAQHGYVGFYFGRKIANEEEFEQLKAEPLKGGAEKVETVFRIVPEGAPMPATRMGRMEVDAVLRPDREIAREIVRDLTTRGFTRIPDDYDADWWADQFLDQYEAALAKRMTAS
jgi:hypothetical protein